MLKQISADNESNRKAYIITGPTSGIGRAKVFEVARRGTVSVYAEVFSESTAQKTVHAAESSR